MYIYGTVYTIYWLGWSCLCVSKVVVAGGEDVDGIPEVAGNRANNQTILQTRSWPAYAQLFELRYE